MGFRLAPRETSFYGYFNQAADNLVVGAELLAKMLSSGVDRAPLAEQLSSAEHDSDEVTHEVYRLLNSTFITPFDREDIYRLAASLDDVMDEMEAAGGLVAIYGLDEMSEEFTEIVDILCRTALVTSQSMPRLQQLRDLEDYWIEVNRLENDADVVYRRLIGSLFSGAYDPLTVLKLKEVADTLEDAADAFEHVANAVETIAVKES